MHIGDTPVGVEIGQWSDPQQVAVAHISLEGSAITVAAVDVPPVRLLAILKGLAPP